MFDGIFNRGKYYYILYLIFDILFLSGCHSFRTTAPPHNSEIIEKVSKPSNIIIPLSIDILDLEKKVNKELNGLIYEDNSLEDNNNDNLMVKAWKKDYFNIYVNGNSISYRLPLKLWVKAGFKFERFGFKLSDYEEFNAEIALKYKTTFSINKDWTLVTKTSPDGYEWLSSPTIKVKGFEMPVTFVADMFLKASQNMITTRIDDTIRKGFNLRKYVDEAWMKLQNSFKVNDEYNVWLHIMPQEISTVPFTSANNKLNLMIAVKSVNELTLGKEPLKSEFIPLPALKIENKLDPKFAININTEIPFSQINDIARKEFVGKTFNDGRRSISILSINAYGSNNNFVVELSVDGSIKGNIYLKGVPYYNAEHKSIEVKDLDFNLSTEKALLRTASWLLHGTFRRQIQQKLVYSIEDKLAQSSDMIQKYLKDNRSIKGMTLNGSLKNIDIDRIYITDDAVKVIIYLEGNLIVNVDGLSKI